MVTISLCFVGKNEEKNIAKFIENVKNLADELIFVDTGSNDKTAEIAKNSGCKVLSFEQKEGWIEEARNLSLKNATCDWILVLDIDERISRKDFEKIKELTKSQEYAGYYLIQRQYGNQIGIANWVSSNGDDYEESKIAAGWYENPILRLFINDKRIKYEGKPHDLVDKSVKQIGKTCFTDIPIHHFGEINRDLQGKAERNIKFLKEQLENPENIEKFYTLYQIGCEFLGKGDIVEAKKHLNSSAELNPDYPPTKRNLAAIFIKEKNFKEAEKILLKVVEKEQSSWDYNNLGIIYSETGELNRAVKKFERAIELNEKSADANFNMGLVYLKMNKQKKAQPFFEKAIELNPEYKKRVKFD